VLSLKASSFNLFELALGICQQPGQGYIIPLRVVSAKNTTSSSK